MVITSGVEIIRVIKNVPVNINALFERINNFVPVRDRITLLNFFNPKDENEVPYKPKIAEEVLNTIITNWQVENGKNKTVK